MYLYPARFGLGDAQWVDPVTAVVIASIGIIAALIFHKLILPLILRLSQRTPTDLDSRMLRATRWPVTLGIVVLGVYLAIVVPLDLSAGQQDAVDKSFGLLGIVLGVMAVVAVVSTAIDWYLVTMGTKTQHVVDVRLFPLLRRIAVALIYALGGLLILDLMEINISPLIAGLGLGGLAVALALQPTLANLFAGTYVMTEGVISPGDYIELEGGITGYVVEVGWRSTRIRNWKNNLVVVPNNKFAETIITNYAKPAQAVNVWFNCGVSYDSDLYRVETVCNEVMDEVLESSTHAIKDYGKYFGFDSFGDSNVNFWLFVQAKDRWGSFVLQTELMQKLHQRLNAEGIVINYPVRTLQFPKEWGPEALVMPNGQKPAKRSNGRSDRRKSRRRRAPRELHVPRVTQDDAEAGDGGEAPLA